jgi:superfamily I DNA/RNA helicase
MLYVSEEQRKIVTDKARIKIVNGCAGGRKTDTLIKCGIHYLNQGKNVIFLTKISSVTDEITKRMERDYNLNFKQTASHFISQYKDSGKYCSVANYDSFIDKQLRKCAVPFEGEAFNQKVRILTQNVERIKEHGLCMKNDEPIDVLLIDEVQDFDKIRIVLTTEIFNVLPNLEGVFVGDTLQTVFVQSIMGESFSMNYLKSNLECKYFELSTCYRCPKGQIDFVNKVMGPYQKKYCIAPMNTSNDNMIDKPVLFQHHSVHKEYERSDLCKRVIHIIDYVLTKDSSITPDDIVVVMNKTNSNAVFEKLLVALNTFYKKRFNGQNYEHVIHYKTKNHEGRKTIDWSVGQKKTKFISIHGIKGKGQKVVILLGMSEKSIPMVEWLFKTEELISQSVMNVALTRSEKYLFVGVNSIPSRYINDQLGDIVSQKLAYCSWDKDTYSDAPAFYKELLTGFSEFEQFKFIADKYTKEIVSTPSKSILAIKEDIVQEYHISDCISNAFMLMSEEVMTKRKFGKRMFISNKMNIVERAVLGTMCELLVQRYMRVYTQNMYYDNKFLVNYNTDGVKYYFSNNQGLLNLVFDTKINSFIKNTPRWYKEFEIIKQKTKHLKTLREELSNIKEPCYILDASFQKIQITTLLKTYFSNVPNTQVPTSVYWNLALFYSALSGHYKMVSVMMYINSFNRCINVMHSNVSDYCHQYLLNKKAEYDIIFQKEINVLKKIKDPQVLSQINPEVLNQDSKKKDYTYGIMGISDIVLEKKDDKTAILHELKCISCSDSAKVKTWIFQSVLYGYLLKKLNQKSQNDVKKIIITNLLSGTIWEFDMTKILIKYRDMMMFIMREKKFPEFLIEEFLQSTRA